MLQNPMFQNRKKRIKSPDPSGPKDVSLPDTVQAPPTHDDFRLAALDLIQRSATLTLATMDPTGPWSAPVYYVWFKEWFCFFSAPESRHIRQALNTGKAAATVFDASEDWKGIRGLQMEGRVTAICAPLVSLEVICRYLDRYPFVRSFFSGISKPDAAAFLSCFRARLYGFVPEAAVYTDNRFGFGVRRSVNLRIEREWEGMEDDG